MTAEWADKLIRAFNGSTLTEVKQAGLWKALAAASPAPGRRAPLRPVVPVPLPLLVRARVPKPEIECAGDAGDGVPFLLHVQATSSELGSAADHAARPQSRFGSRWA